MKALLKAVLIASIIVVGIRLFTVENKENLDDFEITKTETELIFTNVETKEIKKTINLETDNPYIQKYGIKNGEIYFDLNNRKNDFRDFPVSKYIANLFEDYEKGKSPVQMISGATVRISRNKQFVCVYYGLGMGGFEDTEAIYSTVLFKVYNAKGVLLNEIELQDRAGGDFEISENGDFIGSQFRKVDDDLISHRGYMVVEISSSKIVTEDFPPKDTDYSVSGGGKNIKNNQMYFSFVSTDTFLSYTYDFNDKKTFIIPLPRRDTRLKDRVKDGLIRFSKHDKSKTEFISFSDFETKKWDVQ